MSNPLAIFESLRDTYLRYLDSPFDLRYPDLVAERRQLLDADGRLYRYPLIEPVPAYQTCGQTFQQVAQSLLGASWAPGALADLVGFVSQGLFPPARELYAHQREVFQESVVQGRDVIVTTGTGSGKTECFLLPIAAALIRESSAWGAPGPRPAQSLVYAGEQKEVGTADSAARPRGPGGAARGRPSADSLSTQRSR